MYSPLAFSTTIPFVSLIVTLLYFLFDISCIVSDKLFVNLGVIVVFISSYASSRFCIVSIIISSCFFSSCISSCFSSKFSLNVAIFSISGITVFSSISKPFRFIFLLFIFSSKLLILTFDWFSIFSSFSLAISFWYCSIITSLFLLFSSCMLVFVSAPAFCIFSLFFWSNIICPVSIAILFSISFSYLEFSSSPCISSFFCSKALFFSSCRLFTFSVNIFSISIFCFSNCFFAFLFFMFFCISVTSKIIAIIPEIAATRLFFNPTNPIIALNINIAISTHKTIFILSLLFSFFAFIFSICLFSKSFSLFSICSICSSFLFISFVKFVILSIYFSFSNVWAFFCFVSSSMFLLFSDMFFCCSSFSFSKLLIFCSFSCNCIRILYSRLSSFSSSNISCFWLSISYFLFILGFISSILFFIFSISFCNMFIGLCVVLFVPISSLILFCNFSFAFL